MVEVVDTVYNDDESSNEGPLPAYVLCKFPQYCCPTLNTRSKHFSDYTINESAPAKL